MTVEELPTFELAESKFTQLNAICLQRFGGMV